MNVIHSDVRAANIFVAEKGNKVWIIDLEDGEIREDGDDQMKFRISTGRGSPDVVGCPGWRLSGYFSPTENSISTTRVPSLSVLRIESSFENEIENVLLEWSI